MPNRNIKTFTGTSVDVLNVIRNQSSTDYKNFIPIATPDAECIRAIGNVLMQYTDLRNEFLKNLVNRICKVVITSKSYTNPWNVFKKGMLEFGETIEEIFVGLARGKSFDPTDRERPLFDRAIPDVRAAYHVRNYDVVYDVDVDETRMREAFLNVTGVDNLIRYIIESLYIAMEYDEFNTMKYCIGYVILNNLLYTKRIALVTDERTTKDALIAIKTISRDMTYMKGTYCISGVDTAHTPIDNQYFIIPSLFESAMDVDVLAAAFNMDKAEYLAHRVNVDSFGEIDFKRLDMLLGSDPTYRHFTEDEISYLNKIQGILLDGDFLQIYDNLIMANTFENPAVRSVKHFLHVIKTFGISPFCNACVFVTDEISPTIRGITISPISAVMTRGSEMTFNASVDGDYGISHAVRWGFVENVSPSTTISNGIVRIPEDETNETITIRVESVADPNVYATATITVIDFDGVYNGEVEINE